MSEPAATAAALVPRMMTGHGDVISNSLSFVRSHLNMDVAYLSEFVDDDMVFRAVDAPGFEDMVAVGGSMPLADVYCRHILAGRLPALIPDTADVPFAQEIPLTAQLPIRTHVSVPIHRADGSVFGMFCCLGQSARPTLNDRDLEVVRAFAALSADQVNAKLAEETKAQVKRSAIEEILDTDGFEIALQPIMRLKDEGTAGYEALCRFSAEPYRPPNLWFDDAAEVGLQDALEVTVIAMALHLLPHLPDNAYLAVNTSPSTLATGQIADLIEGCDGSRVVVRSPSMTRSRIWTCC